MNQITVYPGDGQIFHRLTSDPDDLESWQSRYERRNPPVGSERAFAVLYMGLSVWESVEQAVEVEFLRRNKGQRPFTFVTEVAVSSERGISFARTGNSKGHFTIWGSPKNLRASKGVSRTF